LLESEGGALEVNWRIAAIAYSSLEVGRYQYGFYSRFAQNIKRV
jgi:hypothetical protein